MSALSGFYGYNDLLSPRGWRVGDLLKGSIPSLGLKWYKNGGIFDSASVIGVGEAGTEAVVPLEKLWNNLDGMKSEIAQSLSATLIQMVPMMAASILFKSGNLVQIKIQSRIH